MICAFNGCPNPTCGQDEHFAFCYKHSAMIEGATAMLNQRSRPSAITRSISVAL